MLQSSLSALSRKLLVPFLPAGALALCSFVGGGCEDVVVGDESEPEPTAAEISAWNAYCEADIARAEQCPKVADPTPSSEVALERCERRLPCFRASIRAEARQPLLDCLAPRACEGKMDDTCFKEVGDAIPPGPGQLQYEESCLAKLSACPSDSFIDDYCLAPGDFPVRLLTARFYEDLTDCFTQSCDAVAKCLHAANELTSSACDGDFL